MDTISAEQRSRVMALIRGKNTKPEMAVRKVLHAMGYRYRLHDRSLPGCPDLVFRSRRKIIMVNGCFWHRHKCPYFRMPKSRVEFWAAKLERNSRRDAKNRRALVKAGWSVLVVWECELKRPGVLAKRLVRFLGSGGDQPAGNKLQV